MDASKMIIGGPESVANPSVVPDAWILRLRAAYEAGYYKTESAPGEQTTFPWQGKTCKDCPFWSDNACLVHGEKRSGAAHTCCSFDPVNYDAARDIVASRVQNGC